MTFEGLTPPYGTLVVDPPWHHPTDQRLGGRNRRPAAAVERYATLTPAHLSLMPAGDLAGPNAHLWLWVTSTGLLRGWHHELLQAWRFTPVSLMTWCKTGQPGLGAYVRSTTEHVILARRGKGTVPSSPLLSSWFTAAREGHSTKPVRFGDVVEQVSPGPYCELFQRQARLGWDGWGMGHEDQFPARPTIEVHLPEPGDAA